MSFLLENSHIHRYQTHNTVQVPSTIWKVGHRVLFLVWAMCAVVALLIAGSNSDNRSWAKRIASSVWQSLIN